MKMNYKYPIILGLIILLACLVYSLAPFKIFEKILGRLRFRKIIGYFKKGDVVLDIGCGKKCGLYKFVKNKVKRYHGIDSCKCGVEIGMPGFSFSKLNLEEMEEFTFTDKSFDKITLLAILEHLNNFELVLKESFRLLKSNGMLLITVPAPKAKPVLEILAKFRILNPELVRQHKNYFTATDLRNILKRAGFKNEKIKINTFEFGFNTFVVAKK